MVKGAKKDRGVQAFLNWHDRVLDLATKKKPLTKKERLQRLRSAFWKFAGVDPVYKTADKEQCCGCLTKVSPAQQKSDIFALTGLCRKCRRQIQVRYKVPVLGERTVDG